MSLGQLFQPYGVMRRLPLGDEAGVLDAARLLDYVDVALALRDATEPRARYALLRDKAEIDLVARRFDLALDGLDEAERLGATLAEDRAIEIRVRRGMLQRRMGRYAQAAATLEAVVAATATPDLLRRRAHLQLGRVHVEQGRFFEAITHLTTGLAGEGHNRQTQLSGRYDLVFAHLHEAQIARADSALDDAAHLVGVDPLDRARLDYYRGWSAFVQRNLAETARLVVRAREVFAAHQDDDARACADLTVAALHFERVELPACLDECARAQAPSETRPDIAIVATLLRARTLLLQGRLEDAMSECVRAEKNATSTGRGDLRAAALEGAADVHLESQKPRRAAQALTACLELRRTIGDRLGEAAARTGLGLLTLRLGEPATAAAHLRDARATAAAIGNRVAVAAVDLGELELHLAAGDLPAAERSGVEALRQLEAVGEPLRQAGVLCRLGYVAALRDDFGQAEARHEQALGLVGDHAVLRAETLDARAEVRAERGLVEEALRDLSAARELAEAAGVTRLAQRLQARGEEFRERHAARTVLGRYMDPKVVARILASGPRRMVENLTQEVTVLFSDIRGYSKLSEQLRAQDVVALLNQHFEAMTEEVLRHGGTIDKFIGDAIMVVFGDPGRPSADDALRAVQAGQAMLRRRAAMNRERRTAGEPPIEIGIGIDSGLVVMGNIGSPRRMTYTVVGDAVNVASRLEGLTKTHGRPLLISGETFARLGGAIPGEPLGAIEVKGRGEKVDVVAILVDPSA